MEDTPVIKFSDFVNYNETNPYKIINNKEIKFQCNVDGDNTENSGQDLDKFFDIILEKNSETIIPEDGDLTHRFVLETYIDKDTFKELNQRILIIADYGDGIKEYHTKPLRLFDDKNNGWDSFTHKFNFKKEAFENDELKWMNFTIYSKLGTEPIIKKLYYKVIDSSNVKLRLLNANLDNNGKISFMFDNIADKKSKIILAEVKK